MTQHENVPDNVFRGKNFSVIQSGGQYILCDMFNPDNLYDTFDELVEDYPACEQARAHFFGEA